MMLKQNPSKEILKINHKQNSMKKIAFALFLMFAFSSAVFSQDYKKVRSYLVLAQLPNGGEKQLENAIAEYEKVAIEPKAAGKAETYLLKAEIYGLVSGNETLRAKYPNSNIMAVEALKKYLELEPKEEMLKEDNYLGMNLIYSSVFNDGVKYYNQKNWDSAFVNFKTAAEVGDLFTARKWSNSTFDTAAYLYAGASAQNAKRHEDAIKYYGRIAESKVVGPDYESIYDFLTKYFYNNKNEAEFQKYLALAKSAYPNNPTWADLEFADMIDNIEPAQMLAKFEEAEKSQKLTSSNYLDYGDYFINNKKIKELLPEQKVGYTNKAAYAFSKANELDTANAVALYNSGVAYYSLWQDYYDAAAKIKGITADIKSKRSQADKLTDETADKAIIPLEKAYNSLAARSTRTSAERNVLGKATDLLFNLYDYKKIRSRGVNVKDYDRYEAKAKYYDSMHGKF